MAEMIGDFIRTFVRAIRLEMEAMRTRLGSFEIPLSSGEAIVGEANSAPDAKAPADAAAIRYRYFFRAHRSDDKLVVGVEGTYRSASADVLVEVVGIDGTMVTLESPSPLDLAPPGASLVIYPWFL
jgi:hypothetical protein